MLDLPGGGHYQASGFRDRVSRNSIVTTPGITIPKNSVIY
jgi:hypothetical protein